jgi:hypothetical protein
MTHVTRDDGFSHSVCRRARLSGIKVSKMRHNASCVIPTEKTHSTYARAAR